MCEQRQFSLFLDFTVSCFVCVPIFLCDLVCIVSGFGFFFFLTKQTKKCCYVVNCLDMALAERGVQRTHVRAGFAIKELAGCEHVAEYA